MIKVFFYIYRIFLSPALTLAFHIQCRYEETCSRYTERMIHEHGIFLGSWIGLKRFISCSPVRVHIRSGALLRKAIVGLRFRLMEKIHG